MSLTGLIKGESKVYDPAERLPASPLEVLARSYESTRQAGMFFGKGVSRRQAYIKREKQYENITGEDLGTTPVNILGVGLFEDKRKASQDEKIKQTMQERPDLADSLRPLLNYSVDKISQGIARQSEEDLMQAMNSNSGFAVTAASFAGAITGAFTDPINVGASIVTGGTSAAGASLLRVAGKEALVNGAIEAVQFPAVYSFRKEAGLQADPQDIFANMALGAAGGAALPVVLRSLSPTALKQAGGAAQKLTSDILYKAAKNEKMPIKMRDTFMQMSRKMQIDEAAPSPKPSAKLLNDHYKATDAAMDSVIRNNGTGLSELLSRTRSLADAIDQVRHMDVPITKVTKSQYEFTKALDGQTYSLHSAVTGARPMYVDAFVAKKMASYQQPMIALPKTSKAGARFYKTADDAKVALKGQEGFVSSTPDGYLAYNTKPARVVRDSEGEVKTYNNRGQAVAAAKQGQEVVGLPVLYGKGKKYAIIDGINKADANKFTKTSAVSVFHDPDVPPRTPRAIQSEEAKQFYRDKNMLDPPAYNIDTIREEIQEAVNQLDQTTQALDAEFGRLGDDVAIMFDDGTAMTAAQMRQQFNVDETFVKAMRTCGGAG